MNAQDLMTKKIVTVKPDTPIAQVAQLMVTHRVSALPVVVEDDRLVGIVTESDLLRRAETKTERKRNWWVEMFLDSDMKAREFVKAHGTTAKDVMSRVVITVPEDATLAEVAAMLDAHGIRRVPVVRQGHLVGIISRSDLVRALVQATAKTSEQPMEDGALHKAIYDALRSHPWFDSLYMTFTVDKGAVTLLGFVSSEAQRQAIEVLVKEIPGVRKVEDRLVIKSWHTAA